MSPLFGGWRHRVGFLPYAVDVFEHGERELQLYLRWRPGKVVDGRWQSGGAWKYRSLKVTFAQLVEQELAKLPAGRVRRPTDETRARRVAEQWAIDQANTQVERNRGTLRDVAPEPAPAPVAPPAKRTLREGWALATDPETGRYGGGTAYHTAVASAMTAAMEAWGADTAWEDLTPASWTKLWRRRFAAVRAGKRKGQGLQTALHDVAYVLAVASWLREHQHIPATAALPPVRWKKQAKADFAERHADGVVPKPRRLRYTTEELRQLLAKAHTVEPRLALLLAVGAELRAGQVLRSKRSALALPPVDFAAPRQADGESDPTNYGTLTVYGRGQKEGTVVDLTRGQRLEVERALVTGYLRELEAAYRAGTLEDYPLFPGRRLVGQKAGDPVLHLPVNARDAAAARGATRALARALTRSQAIRLLHVLEEACGIAPVKGRGFHGTRRGAVDEATAVLNISPAALRHLGGWADEATPRGIYKDQEDVRDRRAARDARARIRGEDIAGAVRASAPAPEQSPKPVNNASTDQKRRAASRGGRSASPDHPTT